jgi:hypothetical protein
MMVLNVFDFVKDNERIGNTGVNPEQSCCRVDLGNSLCWYLHLSRKTCLILRLAPLHSKSTEYGLLRNLIALVYLYEIYRALRRRHDMPLF